MKDSARYAKIVEWLDEDQCYVGSAPGLIFGGCHGDDEKKVFNDLCEIVEEAIVIYHNEDRTLPPPTSGRDFATKNAIRCVILTNNSNERRLAARKAKVSIEAV